MRSISELPSNISTMDKTGLRSDNYIKSNNITRAHHILGIYRAVTNSREKKSKRRDFSLNTVCPRSSAKFYIVPYYMK